MALCEARRAALLRCFGFAVRAAPEDASKVMVDVLLPIALGRAGMTMICWVESAVGESAGAIGC